MVRQLQDPDLIIRQRTLVACRELLLVAECRVQCVAAGCVPALVKLLLDRDSVVRERAAIALRLVGVNTQGCVHLISDRAVTKLVNMLPASAVELGDSVPEVRAAVYGTLIEASRTEIVRAELLSSDETIQLFMGCAMREQGGMAGQALELLKQVLSGRQNRMAVECLIGAGGVKQCTTLLASPFPEVQRGAAAVLGLLAAQEEGKVKAVEAGGLEALVNLLESEDLGVLTEVTAALMGITVALTSKEVASRVATNPAVYMVLLDTPEDNLVVNVLQVIANVCEDAAGRKLLAPLVGKLRSVLDGQEDQRIRYHLAHAIRQLQFEMLPFPELQQ